MAGEGCYVVKSCQKTQEGWFYFIESYKLDGTYYENLKSTIFKDEESCKSSKDASIKGANSNIENRFRQLCSGNHPPRRARTPVASQIYFINSLWTWNRS